MLMLTPTAVQAVRGLTAGEGAPMEAGLRIFSPDDAESFQLALVVAPSEDDEVLTAEGARIFMDRKSADYFEDKILDADLDSNGYTTFVVGPQTPKL
ncbi:hypothetical protein ACFROC_03725 [Nocardia tengchongensis]|uniref:hypothetical protein n=1 Tax=Nocardia tengchongensis TaxID=2055889 RepID=UPI00368BC275